MLFKTIRFSLALLVLSALSVPPGHAALERLFPANAKRGTLSTESYPEFYLDGKPKKLSVGAWIKNKKNTIDMPYSLRGREFVVNYTENARGEIDRVWILTEEEASKPAPADRPKAARSN
jgi:hypothetical protein